MELSHFLLFQGVDLVPTDVVAGLILLSQKHKEKREGLNHVVISDTTSPRYTSVQMHIVNGLVI